WSTAITGGPRWSSRPSRIARARRRCMCCHDSGKLGPRLAGRGRPGGLGRGPASAHGTGDHARRVPRAGSVPGRPAEGRRRGLGAGRLRWHARLLARSPHLRAVIDFTPALVANAGRDAGAFLDTLTGLGFHIEAIDARGRLRPTTRAQLLAT